MLVWPFACCARWPGERANLRKSFLKSSVTRMFSSFLIFRLSKKVGSVYIFSY